MDEPEARNSGLKQRCRLGMLGLRLQSQNNFRAKVFLFEPSLYFEHSEALANERSFMPQK